MYDPTNPADPTPEQIAALCARIRNEGYEDPRHGRRGPWGAHRYPRGELGAEMKTFSEAELQAVELEFNER